MRRIAMLLTFATLCANALAQQAPASPTAPQTARQALIEMFFSKTPGTLMKHLPEATRAALEKAGATTFLQQYAAMAIHLESQGKGVQTFETGSVLLATENPSTGEKVEITVENDSLMGDQDDIEVSFVTYKNGQPQRPPVMSHVTFSMKSEADIWRLNEIAVTIRVPLADPDFLKGITEGIKATSQATTQVQLSFPGSTQSSNQSFGNDASVVAAMRNILNAEATYATTYPSVGYTCTLSDLDGFGGGAPNEHQAMLINSGLASGKKYGYVFTLSKCAGTPASSFHLTAVPSTNSYGRRAFCADQSHEIRTSADGTAASCISSGTPWQ